MIEKRQGNISWLPDQDSRDAIVSELSRSMLVEAAAGTGKTTMMLKRMVALMAAGEAGGCASPRNMAAVTFTRKAAAELRAGFQLSLERAAKEAEGPERERLLAALADIDQCFIGTIHAFCARLLRERPVEARVDLEFEEVDEDDDASLRREAWDRFVAELYVFDSEGLVMDLKELGLELKDLGPAFISFAEYPDVDDWPLPDKGGRERLLETAPCIIREYLDYMEKLAPELDQSKNKTDTLVPIFKRLPASIRSRGLDLESTEGLLQAFGCFPAPTKAVQRPTGWPGRVSCELPGAGGKTQAEYYKHVRGTIEDLLFQARYEVVIKVLKGAVGVYDSLRKERGQLNFQDLLMASARLLRENARTREQLARRYTHLLVDEFQDTDPIQAEVMLLMTAQDPEVGEDGTIDWQSCRPRPGSLFVVGDPKQSIYRFRRADIKTYDRVKEILCRDEGDVITLSSNFRSTDRILTWVNGVFDPLPDQEEDDRTADVMLRFPAVASDRAPAYVALQKGSEWGEGELDGVFKLVIPPGGKSDAGREYEAELIARFIRYACDSGMTVSRTIEQLGERSSCARGAGGSAPAEAGGMGDHRPGQVDYSDFLIITRNRTHMSAYTKKLLEYGVPHEVTGGTTLNDVPELRLLYLFLEAAANPDDPVKLVATLRSELFGISDPELYRFKKAGGRFSYYSTVPAGLAAGEREAFQDSFEKLRGCHDLLTKLPPVAVMEKVISDLGLLVTAGAAPGGDVQVGSIAKALEVLRAAQGDRWTVGQVIEHLKKIVGAGDGDELEKHDGISARSEERPHVRLMNLHQVKGLQAPVVFLADPSGEQNFKIHPVELYVDRGPEGVTGYLAVCGGSDDYGKNSSFAHAQGWVGDEGFEVEEMRFAVAEDLRLRYVAATRVGSAMVITLRELPKSKTDKAEIEKGKREDFQKLDKANPWNHFAPQLRDCKDIAELLPEEGEKAGAGFAAEPRPADVTTANLADAPAERERIAERLAGAGSPTYGAFGAKDYAPSLPKASGQVVGQVTRAMEGAAELAEEMGEEGEHGVEWGVVIHGLLELAGKKGANLESLAEALLRENDLDPGKAVYAVKLVEKVVGSTVWERSCGGGRRLCEVPFDYVVRDDEGVPTIIRGAVDLAFEEDGGWVIVDYKTDSLEGTSAEARAAEHVPQLWVYADAWKACTGEEVVERGILFLESGEYVKLA